MRCNWKQSHLNSLKGWFTNSTRPPGPEAGEGRGAADCVQGTCLADRDVVVKGSACVVRTYYTKASNSKLSYQTFLVGCQGWARSLRESQICRSVGASWARLLQRQVFFETVKGHLEGIMSTSAATPWHGIMIKSLKFQSRLRNWWKIPRTEREHRVQVPFLFRSAWLWPDETPFVPVWAPVTWQALCCMQGEPCSAVGTRGVDSDPWPVRQRRRGYYRGGLPGWRLSLMSLDASCLIRHI